MEANLRIASDKLLISSLCFSRWNIVDSYITVLVLLYHFNLIIFPSSIIITVYLFYLQIIKKKSKIEDLICQKVWVCKLNNFYF